MASRRAGVSALGDITHGGSCRNDMKLISTLELCYSEQSFYIRGRTAENIL